MNTKLIQALLEWVKQGNRCIDLKYDNYAPDKKITATAFCYSYEFKAGKHVLSIDEIPTDDELLAKTIKANEEEYQRLIGRQHKSGLRPLP